MRLYERIKKNDLAVNVVLNTIAAAIPILVLQLVLLPLVAKYMDDNEYGLVVTLLSILNIVPIILGNSLNNIRLLYENKYKENNICGDFPVILLLDLIINVILMVAFGIWYINIYSIELNILHILLVVIISILWLLREYYIVAFLIDLDYYAILINNILLTIGYIIGFAIFRVTGLWEGIYLCGYVCSLVFVYAKTKIWREKLERTFLWKEVYKENNIYVISCLLYRFTTYADKMILYPLLGGLNVSIYYVATLSGKIVTMLITPLCGVMLSYLAKKNNTNKQSFIKVIRYGIGFCVLGYIFCVVVSRPVLGILYPQYVDKAMDYIYITTAVVVIGVMVSLINPYILKALSMKWQVLINSLTLFVYVVGALALLKLFGMIGFCVGTLFATIFKLIIMLCICQRKRDLI